MDAYNNSDPRPMRHERKDGSDMEKVQGRFYLTIHTAEGGAVGFEYNDLETATLDAIYYSHYNASSMYPHKVVRVTLRGNKW